jgi:hypothetical protein
MAIRFEVLLCTNTWTFRRWHKENLDNHQNKMKLKHQEEIIAQQGTEQQKAQVIRARRDRKLNDKFSGLDWTT